MAHSEAHAITRLRMAAAVALAALALAGCGEADDEPAARTSTTPAGAIDLTIAYDDGKGTTSRGTLTCRGAQRRATGALAGRAPTARLCAHARAIAGLLTSQRPPGRACTQIYGGPAVARVTGTLDGKRVARRFTQVNGCEIADFKRAAGLLRP